MFAPRLAGPGDGAHIDSGGEELGRDEVAEIVTRAHG